MDESGADYIETDETTNAITHHVYTAEGLKTWMTAAASNPAISCTLYNCIEWDAGETWTPVGSGRTYTGTFDGGGHTVSNLAIDATGSYAGFFGYIGSKGTVTGLGVSIESISSTAYVGGIAGWNADTISGCWSAGDITSSSSSGTYPSGIAGWNNNGGTITACYSTGNVTASNSNLAGGVAGQNLGTITACYWSNDSVTQGVGNGTDDTTQVTGSVTWETAENAMNNAIGNSVG